jgi:hypothetical protein
VPTANRLVERHRPASLCHQQVALPHRTPGAYRPLGSCYGESIASEMGCAMGFLSRLQPGLQCSRKNSRRWYDKITCSFFFAERITCSWQGWAGEWHVVEFLIHLTWTMQTTPTIAKINPSLLVGINTFHVANRGWWNVFLLSGVLCCPVRDLVVYWCWGSSKSWLASLFCYYYMWDWLASYN